MDRTLSRVRCSLAVIVSVAITPVYAIDNSDEIERIVDQRISEYLKSDDFDREVEASINRYIAKQNEARADRERQALEQAAKNLAAVDPAKDHIRGREDADFTLIEYSDYECPFCKRFHTTAIEFIEKHPDVNWVYRHFPLDFHNPGAQAQAEASECAAAVGGSDAFWQFSDLIYERTTSNGKGFPIENLVPLAEEIGLDRGAFIACITERRFKDKVEADYQNGVASGVSGTPGNFLRDNRNGNVIPVSGAQPLQKLEQILAQMKEAR